MTILDKDKPLQTGFSLVCLAISLFFLVLELWSTRNDLNGMAWDWHTKITVGIGAVGLLFAPFNFGNVWKGIAAWRGTASKE